MSKLQSINEKKNENNSRQNSIIKARERPDDYCSRVDRCIKKLVTNVKGISQKVFRQLVCVISPLVFVEISKQ